MELRDIIGIFQKRAYFFVAIVIVFVIAAWLWQMNQPEKFQATLLLNIGRNGTSQAVDYTYDSFYRLQADERFADTVVRWLSNPRVVEDIYREARLDPTYLGMKDLTRVFTAGRLSPQVVTVRYGSESRTIIDQLAVASVTVLNRYTGTLNTETKDQDWFVIIGSEPVVRDGRVSLHLALIVALVLGVFVGFWTVLTRHYYQTLPVGRQGSE
jgi:capsular polysaccharide biosynthesis protein